MKNKKGKNKSFSFPDCPKCGSKNLYLQGAFDFKYRIFCDDCGFHTKWHLHSYEYAVQELEDVIAAKMEK